MAQIMKTLYATYRNSTWPVLLYNTGRLTCRGPGYGGWGNREVHVGSGVVDMWTAGSSKGPGILYQHRNSLVAVFLEYNTGRKVVRGNVSSKTPSFVRVEAHRYGVVFYVTIEDRMYRVEIDGWGHFKKE